MITGTYLQPARLVLSLFVGIILGLLFDITYIPRNFKHAKKFFQVFFDILYFLIGAGVYVLICYFAVNFDITLYMICGNVVGFIIERKSIAILLAKFYKMLYNLRISFSKRREQNDTGKT